jgi:hypothetical protein
MPNHAMRAVTRHVRRRTAFSRAATSFNLHSALTISGDVLSIGYT